MPDGGDMTGEILKNTWREVAIKPILDSGVGIMGGKEGDLEAKSFGDITKRLQEIARDESAGDEFSNLSARKAELERLATTIGLDTEADRLASSAAVRMPPQARTNPAAVENAIRARLLKGGWQGEVETRMAGVPVNDVTKEGLEALKKGELDGYVAARLQSIADEIKNEPQGAVFKRTVDAAEVMRQDQQQAVAEAQKAAEQEKETAAKAEADRKATEEAEKAKSAEKEAAKQESKIHAAMAKVKAGAETYMFWKSVAATLGIAFTIDELIEAAEKVFGKKFKAEEEKKQPSDEEHSNNQKKNNETQREGGKKEPMGEDLKKLTAEDLQARLRQTFIKPEDLELLQAEKQRRVDALREFASKRGDSGLLDGIEKRIRERLENLPPNYYRVPLLELLAAGQWRYDALDLPKELDGLYRILAEEEVKNVLLKLELESKNSSNKSFKDTTKLRAITDIQRDISSLERSRVRVIHIDPLQYLFNMPSTFDDWKNINSGLMTDPELVVAVKNWYAAETPPPPTTTTEKEIPEDLEGQRKWMRDKLRFMEKNIAPLDPSETEKIINALKEDMKEFPEELKNELQVRLTVWKIQAAVDNNRGDPTKALEQIGALSGSGYELENPIIKSLLEKDGLKGLKVAEAWNLLQEYDCFDGYYYLVDDFMARRCAKLKQPFDRREARKAFMEARDGRSTDNELTIKAKELQAYFKHPNSLKTGYFFDKEAKRRDFFTKLMIDELAAGGDRELAEDALRLAEYLAVATGESSVWYLPAKASVANDKLALAVHFAKYRENGRIQHKHTGPVATERLVKSLTTSFVRQIALGEGGKMNKVDLWNVDPGVPDIVSANSKPVYAESIVGERINPLTGESEKIIDQMVKRYDFRTDYWGSYVKKAMGLFDLITKEQWEPKEAVGNNVIDWWNWIDKVDPTGNLQLKKAVVCGLLAQLTQWQVWEGKWNLDSYKLVKKQYEEKGFVTGNEWNGYLNDLRRGNWDVVGKINEFQRHSDNQKNKPWTKAANEALAEAQKQIAQALKI